MIHDRDVLLTLIGSNTLLDALLVDVQIRVTAGDPKVFWKLKLDQRSSFRFAEIMFDKIVFFDMSYQRDSIFLNVALIKFIELPDSSFYISLDPNPSTLPEAGATQMGIDPQDGFCVHAEKLELTLS